MQVWHASYHGAIPKTLPACCPQVPNVGAVVNYDFPNGVEDYIHRIGRTGRAGATGEAYTFFTPNDGKYARELSRVLREAGQQVPPALENMQSFGGARPHSLPCLCLHAFAGLLPYLTCMYSGLAGRSSLPQIHSAFAGLR